MKITYTQNSQQYGLNRSLVLVVIVFVIAVGGCLGGGTIGTGLPGEGFSGSGITHTQGRSILVQGKVRDWNGKPMVGAKLSVMTSNGVEDVVTDASGNYECMVELGANNHAEIIFTDPNLRSSFPLTKFSQKSDVVVSSFTVGKDGKVRRNER